jgi:hypothetical protein
MTPAVARQFETFFAETAKIAEIAKKSISPFCSAISAIFAFSAIV